MAFPSLSAGRPRPACRGWEQVPDGCGCRARRLLSGGSVSVKELVRACHASCVVLVAGRGCGVNAPTSCRFLSGWGLRPGKWCTGVHPVRSFVITYAVSSPPGPAEQGPHPVRARLQLQFPHLAPGFDPREPARCSAHQGLDRSTPASGRDSHGEPRPPHGLQPSRTDDQRWLCLFLCRPHQPDHDCGRSTSEPGEAAQQKDHACAGFPPVSALVDRSCGGCVTLRPLDCAHRRGRARRVSRARSRTGSGCYGRAGPSRRAGRTRRGRCPRRPPPSGHSGRPTRLRGGGAG